MRLHFGKVVRPVHWPFILISLIGAALVVAAYRYLYHAPNHRGRSYAAQLLLLGTIIIVGSLSIDRAGDLSREATDKQTQSRIDAAETAANQALSKTVDTAVREFNQNATIFAPCAATIQDRIVAAWSDIMNQNKTVVAGKTYTTLAGALAAVHAQNDAEGLNAKLKRAAYGVRATSDIAARNTTLDHSSTAITQLLARSNAYENVYNLLMAPDKAGTLASEQTEYTQQMQLATTYRR